VLKGRVTRLLRVIFLVATLAGLTFALYRLWPDVSAALSEMSWGALALSTALAVGYLVTGMLAWRVTLRELGSPLGLASAAHVYFVSQLGKYVPGSVWAAVAMLRLGRDVAVPRARMAYSYLLSLAFSLLTGLAIGVPALIAYGDYLPLALITLGVLAVVLLWPRLLNALLDRGLRLTRRGRLEQPLSGPGIARIVGLYLAAWLLGGLHVWVLAVAVGADAQESLFSSIAAYTVASTLGILVVLAPAGAGVREVLMVLILTPVAGAAAATTVAVISRATLIVLDLAGAGAAGLGWRWSGHRTDPAELSPTNLET
jgi:uncharacterized membrane protein YbhN (UPF0104 family)